MRTPIATLAVLAGSLAAVAPAADLVDDSYAELRLSGGEIGKRVEVNPNGLGIKTITADENDRVTLDALFSFGVKSYGGWIWGLGGSYNNLVGTLPAPPVLGATEQHLHWQSWSVRVLVGYVIPVGDFRFDILPFAGAGRQYLDAKNSTYYITQHTNDYYRELGINLTGMYLFRNGFEVGATIGILRQDAEDAAPRSLPGKYSYRATNADGMLLLGYRF